MAILTVLLLTVVSTCLAQPADNNAKDRPSRAPQSQIQYSDPDGSKVDWKLYAPQDQWRSHLESARRLERAETGTGQADYSPKQQGPVIHQAPVQVEPQYQPFSSVPSHIKKLIVESYNHQGPYVDPGAFFYQAVVPTAVSSLAPQEKSDHYVSSPSHQLEREYFSSAVNYRASGYQASNEQYNGGAHIGRVPPKAGIKYKDEERLTERSTSLPYGAVIGAQSREKPEYQPYKQIAQSQHQQFNRQASQAQAQFPQYKNRNSDSLSQYSQHNNQNSQINTQYGQYNKQPSQGSQNNQQILQSRQYKQFDSVKPVTQSNFEHNMPMAIQQLLSYQAQLPYNVIANHIVYRPKQLFIPKPLPESAKLAKQYPSKIYFLKTDGQIYDSSEVIKDEKKHEKGY